MMEKLKNVLLHNSFLKITSVVLAFFLWVVVTISLQTSSNQTISDVPINIDMQNSYIKKQGLNLISQDITSVDVYLYGKRVDIAGLSAKDIAVNASLSQVSGAGEYTLSLKPEVAEGVGNRGDIEVSIKPDQVQVKFDKLLDRQYAVTADILNLETPEGYVFNRDDVQISPNEITIRGPEVELDKIARCVVRLDMEGKALNKTVTMQQPVLLLDKNGEVIDSEDLKMEYEEAEVTLKILKNKEIPLKIDFTNVPTNFPLEELEYTLSNETISVSGPAEQVDNITELVVGYVDLRTVTLDSVYTFDVKLKQGLESNDNIASVEVVFDTDGMTKKDFYVTNLKAINAPAGYDVTFNTKQLTNVTVVGPKAIVDGLTAKDIVGEVDLSDRQIVTGQIKMPVNVIVPGKGLVWATGDYTAVINIKEK